MTIHKTPPLDNFISAIDLQNELEKLPNVGHVSVIRTEISTGYLWDVEFIACALKGPLDICNTGDLHLMNVTSRNLYGCGGASMSVMTSSL